MRAMMPGRGVPRVFAAAGVLSVLVFAWLARNGLEPGSSVGMGFGVAAAVMLLVVMLYSVRRSVPSVRSLGPARPYLEIHLYGGLLFLLLVLMHTGFGLPSGGLNITLWLVAIWVVASGLLGLALQAWVPRLLEAETSMEAHAERIPELVAEVRGRADQAARDGGRRVEAFYHRELAPEMAAPPPGPGVLLARGRSLRRRDREFTHLERMVDAEAAPALEELRRLYRTKLDLDLHHTLQRTLRVWLYLHLPLGIVLLALFGLHLFFILYF